MCSTCAVKIHDKEHKVDEFENIQNKGLMNLFFESEDHNFLRE